MFRKALESRNEMCSCPPRHPIILLKSNYFNMATVSVKRSKGLDNFLDAKFGLFSLSRHLELKCKPFNTESPESGK